MNTSEYHLRPATASDLPFLEQMAYQAVFVPPSTAPPPFDIIYHPNIIQYTQHFGEHPGDVGVIACKQSSPLGAAWLRLIEGFGYVDEFTPELTIAVRPDVRNRGIGTALLTHLIDAARPHYQRISLSVDVRNPARRLYQRLGFVDVTNDAPVRTMLLWLKT